MRSIAFALSLACSAALLSGCNDSGSSSSSGANPTPPNSSTGSPLRIGLLPDTQGSGDNVSVHPMEAVMAKLQSLDADIVIPVGDLTNHGTTGEFEQWTGVAEKYRDAGIEFLPLMGNHEDSWAYTVEWVETMRDYIPEDAVHMEGAQYLNYYVIRDNVLIVALKYYNLPIAFQWIKGVVEQNSENIKHIVIASHDGLIGAKYGETREMIVEGTKGQDLLVNQWEDIRAFFSKHDVLWVQGHEHMYQRSVITAPIWVDPGSWTRENGNYRLPQYTQIMAGNASYKGYEFRYGERELVQRIVQQKMNTYENGATGYDANAAVLAFNGDRVDYQAYYTEHTINNNGEGPKELADPSWALLDRFTRTANRCERLVYPNSIPEETRPVMYLDPLYRSNECYADDGSYAKLVDGTNNTFNRLDSRTRTLSYTPGFSRAESQNDLMRLAYLYIFQYHQRWTPNLNGEQRIQPAADELEVDVPETTMDLKEHVTLSWDESNGETVSDVLIVSGTQVQTGTYSSAYGAEKDLETDPGLPGSQPDGTAKQPHTLPETATKSWNIAEAVSDPYVVEFTGADEIDPESVLLGVKTEDGWEALVSADCVLDQPYDPALLDAPPSRPAACDGQPVVGYDSGYGNRWWAIMTADAELALISN